MKTSSVNRAASSVLRRGFTLIELMVAMAITGILVLIIMQMTTQGIDVWKSVSDEVSTNARARAALRKMSTDFEGMQMRLGDNDYQWFFAGSDDKAGDSFKSMKIPDSSKCVFFTSASDRSPAVSSDDGARKLYRSMRAQDSDTQGDVNAVSYRLLFRDQILNIPGTGRKDKGAYPLFSLYRQLISPRDAFEKLIGTQSLEQAYGTFEAKERMHFLCENIIELNMVLSLKYAPKNADAKESRVTYQDLTVPIVSSKGNAENFKLFGDRIEVSGSTYDNAMITAVNISVTVVTDEGMALMNQVRLGVRKAPPTDEFFRKYTRTFSQRIASPSSY